jgi:hypothetical protein
MRPPRRVKRRAQSPASAGLSFAKIAAQTAFSHRFPGQCCKFGALSDISLALSRQTGESFATLSRLRHGATEPTASKYWGDS